ncbi:MAG: hypothetical protein AAF664_06075 [Planctomycetota bacterium]
MSSRDCARRLDRLIHLPRLGLAFIIMSAFGLSSVDGQMPMPIEKALGTADAAVSTGDYATAVQQYRLMRSSGVPASQLTKLRGQLVQIGIDAALLDMPTRPLAPPSNAQSIDAPAITGGMIGDLASPTPKQQVLQNLAVARAQLDAGQIEMAHRSVMRAQALGVPESVFKDGETRVYQVALDVQSAARRAGLVLSQAPVNGISTVGFNAPATNNLQPSAVQPAIAMAAPGASPAIGKSVFNSVDTPNANAIAQVQAVESAGQVGELTSKAQQAFDAGMEALSQGDSATAQEKFKEAWPGRELLSQSDRAKLQDKLTLLRPTRLGTKSPSDRDEPLSDIEKADMESQMQTRRLNQQITSELAKIEQDKTEAPLDALDSLERLRRRVDQSPAPEMTKRSLGVLVDRSIKEQKVYIENNRADIDLQIRNDAIRAEMAREDAQDSAIDAEVSSLVDEFNDLMRQRRFAEAEIVAKQVADLLPNDPIAVQMTSRSRMAVRLEIIEDIKARREDQNVREFMEIEEAMIAGSTNDPYTMPDADEWANISRIRLQDANSDRSLSDGEKRIKIQLGTPIKVNYRGEPLGEVMRDLSAITGIPIVLDERALNDLRVTSETPVTLEVASEIRMTSALNLMLEQLDLAYVIENDVLMITSKQVRDSRVYPVTYRVANLVTPIPNFPATYDLGLAGALRNAYQMTRPSADVQLMPVSPMGLNNRVSSTDAVRRVGEQTLGQYAGMGSGAGFSSTPTFGGPGGGQNFADFDSLMQLIETTVNPETWEALGGQSTMEPYPQNLSLIISTTSETHDQISDLLESLRRLQNLQIAIEVRFVTLADTFAEQIGVDFDLAFDDNTPGLPDDDEGPTVTVGLNGDGTFTPDLDITLDNSLLTGAPAFGGAAVASPTTVGFAILSDIEAFFFLQAIQADSRTNVMQAPKVTMFDGQIATINDVSQRPFVTSVTPVVGDFAVAQQPIITVLNEGTQLSVQGIVSDDKRFVRLTLVPFFSQIGDVTEFTFEGRRTTNNTSTTEQDTNGDGIVDDNDAGVVDNETESDTIAGTTVQLPTFAFTTVSTTVSVPDGGTVMLGGIKRMSESRSERGLPVLSKIPYVSRLFRNVSVGRTASSLMLLVTPRIIIQEEEELAQTGFQAPR